MAIRKEVCCRNMWRRSHPLPRHPVRSRACSSFSSLKNPHGQPQTNTGAGLPSAAGHTEFCSTPTILCGEFRVSERKPLVVLAWPCSKLFSDQNKAETMLFCTDIISHRPLPLVWRTWSRGAKHLLTHQHLPPPSPGAQVSAPDRHPPPLSWEP